jgi:hypothetical protein
MTDFRKSKVSLLDKTTSGNFITINRTKNVDKIFIGDLEPSQFKKGPQSTVKIEKTQIEVALPVAKTKVLKTEVSPSKD